MNKPAEKNFRLVTVNMGYGHQRTAYALKDFAFGEIINANDYKGMPANDRKIWQSSQSFYEFISRFKRVPLLGNLAFKTFDKFQKILEFYPKRDLSKPSFTLKNMYSLIEKGWGADLIKKISAKPMPLVCTFFIPAFMAEFFDYPGDIYCVICDADISRSWAPKMPKTSRIKYLAPNNWGVERLKLYGIKEENIFKTGYPLPLKNVGVAKKTLKKDMGYRMLNLDPKKRYLKNYKPLILEHIGELPEKSDHPLTLLFSVGGAGAQKELAIEITKSLKEKIIKGEIKIILSAGIRSAVKDYFREKISRIGLEKNKNVEILYEENVCEYFKVFNEHLKKTDILWSKPSEISFYTALGIPIVIAPTIGSQEDFNKHWLTHLGSGIPQRNPKYTGEWLFDIINDGRLAEAAMEGYIKAESQGAENIGKVIFK